MSIKSEFNNLKDQDIWSLLLFSLAQMQKDGRYRPLSELPFILDKNSFFNLCQYFGGLTITIPTLKDLEVFLNALILYKYVDIDGLEFCVAVNKMKNSENNIREIKEHYSNIKNILDSYEFTTRG